VDAVEECPDSPGIPSPREKVLNLVEGMVDSHPDLWICVTSRPEQDIRMVLEPLACHHISHRDEDRGMTSLTTRALLCAQTERCGNGDRKIRNLLFVRLPSGPMECKYSCRSVPWSSHALIQVPLGVLPAGGTAPVFSSKHSASIV
jgi:hypothetical protein